MNQNDADKIIAAIDRNTKELQGVGDRIISCSVVLWLPLMLIATIIGCPRAKASPILTTPEPVYEIGTPPMPPPNPHVQYWYTEYVPGPDGVLPVEVFAPRLVLAQVAGDAVEVPEPILLHYILSVAIIFLLGFKLGFITKVLIDEKLARRALEESK